MKLLALTPWPFIPARTGGTERCYNLLSALDDVTAFALDWTGTEKWERHGTINYRVIPADAQASDQAKRLMANGLHSYDGMPSLTKRNLTTIRAEIANTDPDLIILEHPWMLDLIGDTPFIYDAHNYETNNTLNLFGRNTLDIDIIRNIETRAIQQAEHITYCSEADWQAISRDIKHNTPGTLIRNGATAVTGDRLETHRQSRNLLFIGSMYAPNIEAARHLIDIAPQLPDYTIQIVGPCATALTTAQPNVQLIGTVTDAQRDQLFSLAHQFVNLADTGSGTHLKIARALAHSLPVVTTTVGARGYDNMHIVSHGLTALQLIRQITDNYDYAYKLASETFALYDWATIGADFREVINNVGRNL